MTRKEPPRCWGCNYLVSSANKLQVCHVCYEIARGDPERIRLQTKREGLTISDMLLIRMRVRSAVHYARIKRDRRLAAA